MEKSPDWPESEEGLVKEESDHHVSDTSQVNAEE